MPLRREQLPEDPAELARMVVHLDGEVERLKAMLRIFQDAIFGARSERRTALSVDQIALDLGDLPHPDPRPDLPASNDNAEASRTLPRRGKDARRNVGALPLHLPRIEEVIEPAHTTCPCCAGPLHRIGEDVREALSVVPASYWVKRRIFPKYACRACEGAVVQARAPERVVDGGMATNELVVSVAVAKFAWFLPLHRQVQIMGCHGLHLDRSTLAVWMKRLAWWLRPLYERQLQALHRQPRLFCDETPLPVLVKGQPRTRRGQMWAHAVDDRPWQGPAPPAVTYVYAGSRSGRAIAEQLSGFSGLLQVDGYGAYKALARTARGRIDLAFCLAHARRKFVAVHKATGSAFAAQVIAVLAEVYGIEAAIRGRTAADRKAVRQARTRPLLEALESEMRSVLAEISSQSGLAKAIRYTLAHWDGLTRCLEDGRLELDTNTVERTMRSVALTRKNSLFAGNAGGAETWAILASLIQTARLNGLDPTVYLNDVLDRIVSGATPVSRLDDLLAWNWKAGAATDKLAA
jgi:transposase